jgi:hypothetical protein
MVGLAAALHFSAYIAHYNLNAIEVEHFGSELIDLSTRHNFSYWLATGTIFCGWARSLSGNVAQGISWNRGLSGNGRDTSRTLLAGAKG